MQQLLKPVNPQDKNLAMFRSNRRYWSNPQYRSFVQHNYQDHTYHSLLKKKIAYMVSQHLAQGTTKQDELVDRLYVMFKAATAESYYNGRAHAGSKK